MIHHHDAATDELEFEFERLRLLKQRRREERWSSNQIGSAAIKMLIGDWYVDEFGIPTREIKARN